MRGQPDTDPEPAAFARRVWREAEHAAGFARRRVLRRPGVRLDLEPRE